MINQDQIQQARAKAGEVYQMLSHADAHITDGAGKNVTRTKAFIHLAEEAHQELTAMLEIIHLELDQ